MASIISNCTNDDWKNSKCKEHEKEMLSILEKDCYSFETLGTMLWNEFSNQGFFYNRVNSYDILSKLLNKDIYIYFTYYDERFEIGYVKQGGFQAASTNSIYNKLNNTIQGLTFNEDIFYSISKAFVTNIYRNTWISKNFKIRNAGFDLIFAEIFNLLRKLKI